MSQSDLTQERLDAINNLKSSLEAMEQYFNEAFSGNATMQRQDVSLENMLGVLPGVQTSLLHIREVNSKMVANHQLQQTARRVHAIQASYKQMVDAMNQVNNVMALGDSSQDMVDNTNYAELGSGASDDNFTEDDHSGNFSQPGKSPAASEKEANDEQTATPATEESKAPVEEPTYDDEPDVSEEPDASSDESFVEKVESDVAEENDDNVDDTEESEDAETPKNPSSAIDNQQAQAGMAQAHEVVDQVADNSDELSFGGVAPIKSSFANNSANDSASTVKAHTVRSAEEEYEAHKREAEAHPEWIKSRLASVKKEMTAKEKAKHEAKPKNKAKLVVTGQNNQKQAKAETKDAKPKTSAKSNRLKHHGMAIKWPGSHAYITKDGKRLVDKPSEIRDVTPKEKDQDMIDNMLNEDLNKIE